jgi:hypothetical protein
MSNIIDIVLNIMTTHPPCPLSTRVTDFRKWYIPNGKTSQQCTYCEECYEKFVRGTDQDKGFTWKNDLLQCNCDYPGEISKFGLMRGDLNVLVLDAPTMKPFLPNSIGQFHLPLHRSYVISVRNLTDDKYRYISLVSYEVDSRTIVVNNGQNIHYKEKIEVGGYYMGLMKLRIQQWTHRPLEITTAGIGYSYRDLKDSCLVSRVSQANPQSCYDVITQSGPEIEFELLLEYESQTDTIMGSPLPMRSNKFANEISERTYLLNQKMQLENDLVEFDKKLTSYENLKYAHRDKLDAVSDKLSLFSFVSSSLDNTDPATQETLTKEKVKLEKEIEEFDQQYRHFDQLRNATRSKIDDVAMKLHNYDYLEYSN